MSLYDRENPQHQAYMKRHIRRDDPTAPLDPVYFCQVCEQPHDWCDCPTNEGISNGLR